MSKRKQKSVLRPLKGKLTAFLALAAVFYAQVGATHAGWMPAVAQLQVAYLTKDMGVEMTGPQFVRSPSVQVTLRPFSTSLDIIDDATMSVTYDAKLFDFKRAASDPACRQDGKGRITCKVGELRGYQNKAFTLSFALRDQSFICGKRIAVMQATISSKAFEVIDDQAGNNTASWQNKVDYKCAVHTGAPGRATGVNRR